MGKILKRDQIAFTLLPFHLQFWLSWNVDVTTKGLGLSWAKKQWKGWKYSLVTVNKKDGRRPSIYKASMLFSRSVMSNSLRPHGHSPPGSAVHEIFQARTLEWIAISFARRSSQPRNWTHSSCLAGALPLSTWKYGTSIILDYLFPDIIFVKEI